MLLVWWYISTLTQLYLLEAFILFMVWFQPSAPTNVTVAGGPQQLNTAVASNPTQQQQPRPPISIVSTQPIIRHHTPGAASSAAQPQLVATRPIITTIAHSPMTTTTVTANAPQAGRFDRPVSNCSSSGFLCLRNLSLMS